MALIRPSLSDMVILDALYDKEIQFNVFGGDQFNGYEIEIYNNETNVLHYYVSKSTYSTKFNIEANVLANGNVYRLRVRTFYSSSSQTDYSEYSDFMLVKCYTTPVCSIDNLLNENGERVIGNQNHIFEGSFYQAENIPLKSYQYILYDEDKKILQTFNIVYSTGKKTQQSIEGFSSRTTYYIELICTDQNNLTVSTGLIDFYVLYEAPRIRQVVHLENDKDNAAVNVSCNMIQIIFKIDPKPPIYINDQELDLRNNTIAYLDEQLNLTGNFTLKIYAKNIPSVDIGEESYFCTLKSIDNSVQIHLKESEGYIHAYKILTPKPNGADIISHYMSAKIENYEPEKSYLVIQINHVNRRIDIYAQVIERQDI